MTIKLYKLIKRNFPSQYKFILEEKYKHDKFTSFGAHTLKYLSKKIQAFVINEQVVSEYNYRRHTSASTSDDYLFIHEFSTYENFVDTVEDVLPEYLI